MTRAWNLTPNEWSKVLQSDDEVDRIAGGLRDGHGLPWASTLSRLTEDSKDTLDLGCGKGELSAMLALEGKKTTLLDWSEKNIDFTKRLYQSLRLNGEFCQADMTNPLPFKDASFDTVFSCGVFEYFSDEQIKNILRETFRVSRKRVIVMVPNAYSISYRIGKWYMEKTKQWHWGGERPFGTLKPYFQAANAGKFIEYSVGARHSLDFLTMMLGGKWTKLLVKLFQLKHHPRPAWFNQGYLLIAAGDKA